MNWETLVLRLLNGVQASNICSAEGDNDGGAGGDAPKTFTQDQVNAFLAKERKGWETKSASELEEAKTAAKAKSEELSTQLKELKQQLEDKDLNAQQKEQKAIERAQKAMQDKIAELEKQVGDATSASKAATKKLVDEYKGQHLSAGLLGAEVHQPALADALAMFRSIAKVELDDNGKFVSATLDDATHTNPLDAAKAFLKVRPWFAAAKGGAGTQSPTNQTNAGVKSFEGLSSQELITEGLKEPKK